MQDKILGQKNRNPIEKRAFRPEFSLHRIALMVITCQTNRSRTRLGFICRCINIRPYKNARIKGLFQTARRKRETHKRQPIRGAVAFPARNAASSFLFVFLTTFRFENVLFPVVEKVLLISSPQSCLTIESVALISTAIATRKGCKL